MPGLTQVQLSVVTRQTAARALYAAFGFVPFGLERQALTLDGEFRGAGFDLEGSERVALALHAQLERSDFGLVWNRILETGGLRVGNTVELALDLSAVRVD